MKHLEVKEAWDQKVELRNSLVDLLIDKGMDESVTVDTVDALCDSVEEFTFLADKYTMNKSNFTKRENEKKELTGWLAKMAVNDSLKAYSIIEFIELFSANFPKNNNPRRQTILKHSNKKIDN